MVLNLVSSKFPPLLLDIPNVWFVLGQGEIDIIEILDGFMSCVTLPRLNESVQLTGNCHRMLDLINDALFGRLSTVTPLFLGKVFETVLRFFRVDFFRITRAL